MIYAIYIINKAGGLAYQKNFNDGLQKLSSNDYLVLAGTFHGVHAITSKISPQPSSSGIELLECDAFKIHCFQTQTGTKFLLITDPNHQSAEIQLRRLYELYADYVMKNPFHTPEMPVRSEKFDLKLTKMVATVS